MIELARPDDWHVHLRDGDLLRGVLAGSAGFGRVLAMPNLAPPVQTAAEGRAYLARIRDAGPGPTVHLAAYLTDHTDPADLLAGQAARIDFVLQLNLMPGEYFLSVGWVTPVGDTFVVVHRRYDAMKFAVLPVDRRIGIANLHSEITVTPLG